METQKPSLAFTFQKKKIVQKVAVNVEEQKDVAQLISGIEGAKIQVVGGETGAEVKTYIIPKIENTYQTGVGPKKFTPTYKPPTSDANVDQSEDRFVQAASTAPVITEYGLQLRVERSGNRGQDAGPSNGAVSSTTAAALDARAFREAVQELPDANDVEAYETMPVEEFGKAMLRGMGWEEGMGVGRNRQKVDAIEYVRRPERLGLGAQPVALAADPTKPVKMGDNPQPKDLVLPPDAEGRQRNVRKLDEQLVARSTILPGPQPGKVMRITAGPHAGLACTALEALPAKGDNKAERWAVRLSESQEVVAVLASELGEKGERAKAESAKDVSGSVGGDGGEGRQRDRDAVRAREGNRREGSGEPAQGAGSRRDGFGAADSNNPSSRRVAGRDLESRGQSLGRDYDRPYDRDRNMGRQPGQERHDQDIGVGGSGGKRRVRDDERRTLDDDTDGRGAKKSRGSERDRRVGDHGADEEYERRHDDRDDGGDARDYHRKNHKHEKKDKKEKKSKKEKKDKKKKEKETGRDRTRYYDGDGDVVKRPREEGGDGDSDSPSEDSGPGQEDGGKAGRPGREDSPSWLFPNIKVRIVDKNVRGGKLYLKKGSVVDVHPGATADVAVDDTGDVLRLPQSALETVVPRSEGAAVLVVAGRHRGCRGRLLQASTASGAAAVQLASDFSIIRLLLDDVAGFVGELDED